MKKNSKIVFKKGITRINFPILTTGNFFDDIRKIERLKLPKHSKIGFEWCEYKGKDAFNIAHVYIEK